VKGGFPCFERNLPIEDSTESKYMLNFGEGSGSVGQATLIHNMKWSGDTDNNSLEISHRKAYLSSLLLQVYSDLFDKGLYPETLKWSYPSAMGDELIGSYDQLWSSLSEINPLSDEKKHKLTVRRGIGDLTYDQNADTAWGGSNGGTPSDEAGSSDGAWGDSSASASSGWGSEGSAKEAAPSEQSGWAEEQPKTAAVSDIEIDDDSPLQFDFEQISGEDSLTESCAVANFLATKSGEISKNPDALTLCFDIGGSTTDILVLGQMNQGGLSMVKQSSIRFAAQRVAQATKYSPNFRSVLVELLDKKGVTVEGINKGTDKYTENTAPYYFEQLVDRLEGAEFDELYRLLGSKCKEMVSVNIYVTGLIVYYAGQLARKVKMEIDKSPNKHPGWKNPKIQLQFTGKGSRIMDWLKAINPNANDKYYMDMFIMGFGGMDAAKEHLGGPPKFQQRDSAALSADIKFEVAKGLASAISPLYVPKKGAKPLEVIGEDGFELLRTSGESIPFSSDSSITPSLMENIGGMFLHRPKDDNKPCPRFMEFAHVYFQVATQFFGLKASQDDFMKGFTDMNIADYITQMPEYKTAKQSKKGFDFVAPIIILEGMQFFEKVILKRIAQK